MAIVVIRCNDTPDDILSVKPFINEYINHFLFILSPGHTAVGSLPFLSYGHRVYKQIYRSKELRPLRHEIRSYVEKFTIDLKPISKDDHEFGLKSYQNYESNLKVLKRNKVVDSLKKYNEQKASITNDKSGVVSRSTSETKAVGINMPTKTTKKTHFKIKTLNLMVVLVVVIKIFMKFQKKLKSIRLKGSLEKEKREEIAKIEWPTIQETRGFTQKRAIMDAKKQYEFVTHIKYHQLLNNHILAHEEVISADKSQNTVSQLIRHEIVGKLDVLETHPIIELSTRFIYHKSKLITILWTPYSGDNRNILIKMGENTYFENPPTRFSNWLTILKYHENKRHLDGTSAKDIPITGWSRSSKGVHDAYGKLVYTNHSSIIRL